MNIWTLWLILVLNDGSVSIMEGRQFTNENSCRQVANYARTTPITGTKRVTAVCKLHTNT
jgi:hypothetical protein